MASQYLNLPKEGGTGVTSLNSLTGALTLLAGTGISITPSGTNITISGTGSLVVGTIDSNTPSADGASVSAGDLIMQSASDTLPGLVNNTTQSFSGAKTFEGLLTMGTLSSDSHQIYSDGTGVLEVFALDTTNLSPFGYVTTDTLNANSINVPVLPDGGGNISVDVYNRILQAGNTVGFRRVLDWSGFNTENSAYYFNPAKAFEMVGSGDSLLFQEITINTPPATIGPPSGVTITPIDVGGGQITDNGYVWEYHVYSYINTPSGRVYSSTYADSGSYTDPNTGSSSYNLDISWTAAAGADGYIAVISSSLFGYAYDWSYDSGSLTDFTQDLYDPTYVNSVVVTPTSWSPVSLTATASISAPEIIPGNGATGTFTTADAKTVTVTNGIITSIV